MAKPKSTINEHVEDWAVATGLLLREQNGGVQILKEGTPIGEGKTVGAACSDALRKGPGDRVQALFVLGALSYGPDEMFDAFAALWADDDEDEDDDDEDSEDEDEDDDDSDWPPDGADGDKIEVEHR